MDDRQINILSKVHLVLKEGGKNSAHIEGQICYRHNSFSSKSTNSRHLWHLQG